MNHVSNHPLRKLPDVLPDVVRLLRTRMTSISAVTFLAATLIPIHAPSISSSTVTPPLLIPPYSLGLFAALYLFVLFTQLSTHAFGEAADLHTDRINRTKSPITGGSRVLTSRNQTLSPRIARLLGYAFMLAALTILRFLVPSRAHPVGLAISLLSLCYGHPPIRLNARALGELEASYITNVLLPVFVVYATVTNSSTPPPFSLSSPTTALLPHWYHPSLILVVMPLFFHKFALFLIFNLADRRPDWATGKITLPVLLGDRGTARLVACSICSAYASALALTLSGRTDAPILALLQLTTAPYALTRVVAPLFSSSPFETHQALQPVLLLNLCLGWLCALYYFIVRLIWYPESISLVQVLFAVWRLALTFNTIKSARHNAPSPRLDKRVPKSHVGLTNSDNSCPQTDALDSFQIQSYSSLRLRHGRQAHITDTVTTPHHRPMSLVPDHTVSRPLATDGSKLSPAGLEVDQKPSSPIDHEIIVVGAGVSGLVAAATLHRLGRKVYVLERRPSAEKADSGADVALWPGAVKVLRELGVARHSRFENECYPLELVHMCNMDFESCAATILKTINMRSVTEATAESFKLLSRESLMATLRSLVPSNIVRYGSNVVHVEEDDEGEQVVVYYQNMEDGVDRKLSSRVVIAADGARSLLRSHVVSAAGGGDTAVTFCGEVCYRGVIHLQDGSERADKIVTLLPDPIDRYTMRINYGAGLRSSYGFLSADGSRAYWWVKELTSAAPVVTKKKDPCLWPQPLKTLHDLTPEHSFYVHPIEDSAVLRKWSSTRVVLIGDSAHTVTPNMGQGACMAIEDAFVLSVMLAEFWKEPDGHLEAFYQYEHCRKPPAVAVRSEARMQLFLGQLRSATAVRMRETLLRSVPSSVLEKKLRKHIFNVTPHVEVYRKLYVPYTKASESVRDLH